MADQVQDPSQDQDFIKAPLSEQHAYLMDSDPEYAKAPESEQQAYLAHIAGNRARAESPTSRALTAQTAQAAGSAGETQTATKPVLPVPTPTGPLSRFVSGAAAEAAPKIPSLASLNPISKENLANVAMGPSAIPVNLARAAMDEYKKSRAENQPVASSAVAGMAAPMQFNTEGIRERARQNDIAGLGGMTAADITAMVLGPRALEAAKPHIGALAEAPRAVVRKVGEPYGVGVTGEEMLTKGISPRASATGFKESLLKAGPDIRAFHNESPIKNVQDLNDAIPEIKQKIWTKEVEPSLARQAKRPIDMAPVANAVREQVTPEMREFDEANATKLDTLADKLEKARDVESGNRLLKYVNGQLDSYFAKYPSARRSNLMNNPETAGWEAARSSLRQQFLQTLEDAGEKGVRDARLRYGALEDIGKEVERRVNVADRAKPMSLSRILGIAGAPVTGGLSIAAGELAHHLNKPDVLVRRGIARLPEAAQRTITMPPAGPEPTTGGMPPAPVTPPPASRNVMVQPPATTRATPTGEATIFEGRNGQLPAEIHADLERQAGRKLTPDEAIALDRANAERGMVAHKAEDIGAVREQHRATLEKKGRQKIPKEHKANDLDMSDPDARFGAARHEAGHAVIGETLRPGSLDYASLTPEGGVTRINPARGKDKIKELSPDERQDLLTMSLAGGASEPGGTTPVHSSADMQLRNRVTGGRSATFANDAMRFLRGKTLGEDPMLAAPQDQATAQARLMRLFADPKNQGLIDRVAAQLNERGKLSGNQVRGLIR